MFHWFENLTNAFPDHEPQQPPKTLFGFCRYYTRGFEKPLLLMSLLSACVAIAEVTLVRYMGELVDMLSNSSRANFWAENGSALLSMALLVLVVMPVLAFIHSNLLHQAILGNYPMSIRWLVHRYLLKQSVGFFQRDFAGRVATKVMQSAHSVREVVMKLVDLSVYIAVYFVSMLVMIASADDVLVLPILAWLCLYILIQVFFIPRLKRISTAQADAQSSMTGSIVDTYTNITTVKLFSHSQRETQHAQKGMKNYLATVYQQMRTLTSLLYSVDLINYLLLFSMAALSIHLWLAESVTVGVIAIGISIALRLQGMSKWIMWEIRGMFESIGMVIDSINTIANDIEIEDATHAKPLAVTQGDIRFHQVGFQYNDQKAVFDGLDLHLKPGEKVGIVGRSGAGKSTLVNLLLRFYDLNAGRIEIDGQDIAQVTQESLRQQIGMITQDTSLLHRSIRENILYGNPHASEAELMHASRQAEAHDFIELLQDESGHSGYDVQVGERGVKLSGGQRQRIAIARVLLKDAPILIMDEATSALDSEVEAAIQENLDKLMENKTVIAIAHRLSTIAAMDRLIVMDQGQIVEQGSHQELLAQNGVYAQLWAHQTGGFIGEA
ncbi:ABC transporter ATP-binding protein/permease [Vibrio fluvialis]|uniref:ABC transporter ATP-binding protein n=1 Tax=Vibrio fluvialis TaxID=676 RepID=UPI001C9CA644|nr:ABC transporter ATP-binding protein [Vibrio fluvialis]EKO3983731.1 ABC transporter ATP-binding protein [Vibrio fluvialis]MBY7813020.1 ABC transporter ATP-binding protein/permease [Vibrio fluvialis]MBY7821283.1 ABC transporter ATP-binding protein/permease [Vibrio fluvialis]MBY7962686.1 ABC transporter ATP-binding protein/permease [Vibrio fluvialis]MBY7966893.1 ABC transporter ATP-binding protein/permease [Vibrio fluvialis]